VSFSTGPSRLVFQRASTLTGRSIRTQHRLCLIRSLSRLPTSFSCSVFSAVLTKGGRGCFKGGPPFLPSLLLALSGSRADTSWALPRSDFHMAKESSLVPLPSFPISLLVFVSDLGALSFSHGILLSSGSPPHLSLSFFPCHVPPSFFILPLSARGN